MIKQSKLTVHEIKTLYELNKQGYFFSKGTMAFFGDTMESYLVGELNGLTFMCRKPSALVDASFSRRQVAGWEFFTAWTVDTSTGEIELVDEELKRELFDWALEVEYDG